MPRPFEGSRNDPKKLVSGGAIRCCSMGRNSQAEMLRAVSSSVGEFDPALVWVDCPLKTGAKEVKRLLQKSHYFVEILRKVPPRSCVVAAMGSDSHQS